MTDPRISYQEQMPPVPVGDGLSRWTGHILHDESLQVCKFPPGAGDANPDYVPR